MPLRPVCCRKASWLPDVSVGINDLIGTGVYSSEYVVASKRLGDFDATLGMGWGRLAGTDALANPFKVIGQSFGTRTGLAIAGGTDFSTLFHGPSAGLFGGVTWHTPIKGLSPLSRNTAATTIELETALGQFKPQNQFNYGVSYQVTSGVSVGLSWLYGRTIGGTISFQTDPDRAQYPAKIWRHRRPSRASARRRNSSRAINALLGGRHRPQGAARGDAQRSTAMPLWTACSPATAMAMWKSKGGHTFC